MEWKMILIHHTGAEEKDTAQVKRYHLSRGWRDIGYNFVIERDGKIVEGRSLNIAGAHARGFNSKAIGVALIGNFENRLPTSQQLTALNVLLLKLVKEHNIPQGEVFGHRQVKNTLCPGKYFPMASVKKDLANGLQPKSDNNKYWRVQTGAFNNEDNAKDYAKELNKLGIETYVIYN